jgi:NitT/TauT family transport system ATP-binding protein
MIDCRGVSKFYPAHSRSGEREISDLIVVLDRIDITIGRGELVTLIGPSGCGKTTLLRIAAGLVIPDEGYVAIAGDRVVGPRRDASMVFQNFGLLPWRTVSANVEFPLEIDGVPAAEREEIAQHFLQLVGLGSFRSHFPHELSGGMQQRVGIARALVRRPLTIFMDEPFGALDAQTRETLQQDFLRIWSTTGATVLFVTHSLHEALILSDRIVVMAARPGRIRTVLDSPVADRRLGGDVLDHPDYTACRAGLRQQLQREDP